MRLVALSILIFFTMLPLIAQEGTWVSTTGKFSGEGITPEEAKSKALDIARGEAIKQVVGIKMSEELFRNQSETMKSGKSEDYFDTFSRLSRSTAVGRILNEEKQFETFLEKGVPVYLVHLHALVAKETGEADPTFKVDIALKNPVLVDRGDITKNDQLNFRITASKNCYVYIFNLLANDSVQLIMPSIYLKNYQYLVDKKEQEFEKDIRAMGIQFFVGLPTGLKRAKEALYVIALKDKIDFTFEHFNQDEKNTLSTYQTAMTDIMNWLIRIPIDRRTEAFQSYEIRSSKE